MTVAADIDFDYCPIRESVRMADGGRMIMRMVLRLAGAALVLACLGLWLAPGASWETDVMLFKLILSVLTGLVGLALLQASAAPRRPEVEIDTIRGELRLIRPHAGSDDDLLQRCSFKDLHRAELRGRHLRLWDQGNKLIAEIAISNRRAVASMLDLLRDHGKLI